jgi:hypothetical protein
LTSAYRVEKYNFSKLMTLSLKHGRDELLLVHDQESFSYHNRKILKQIKLLRAYHGCLGANRR